MKAKWVVVVVCLLTLGLLASSPAQAMRPPVYSAAVNCEGWEISLFTNGQCWPVRAWLEGQYERIIILDSGSCWTKTWSGKWPTNLDLCDRYSFYISFGPSRWDVHYIGEVGECCQTELVVDGVSCASPGIVGVRFALLNLPKAISGGKVEYGIWWTDDISFHQAEFFEQVGQTAYYVDNIPGGNGTYVVDRASTTANGVVYRLRQPLQEFQVEECNPNLPPTPVLPLTTKLEPAHVVVVIYGGWDGIPIRAWVGGTEQSTLFTARDAYGEAAVHWDFYPPLGEEWTVSVIPVLPPELDPRIWGYDFVRLVVNDKEVSGDWLNATVKVRPGGNYVYYFQLVDRLAN